MQPLLGLGFSGIGLDRGILSTLYIWICNHAVHFGAIMKQQIHSQTCGSAAGNATVSVGPSAQKVPQDNAFHTSFAQDNGNSLI